MTETQAAELLELLQTVSTDVVLVNTHLDQLTTLFGQIGTLCGLWLGFYIFEKILRLVGVGQWFARIERDV